MDNKLSEQVSMIKVGVIASIEPTIDEYILTKMKIHSFLKRGVKPPEALEHNLNVLSAEINEKLNNISKLIKQSTL